MAKFVFNYIGGTGAVTPPEQEAMMAAWGTWLGGLGSSLADSGGPFGESATVGGPSGQRATGYSVVEADSIDAAKDAASGCPILTAGGAVEIYEVLAM